MSHSSLPARRPSSHTSARGPADARPPAHRSNRRAPAPAPAALFDAVQEAVRRAVAALRQEASVTILSAEDDRTADSVPTASPLNIPHHRPDSTQTIRVDGPRGRSVHVRVSVTPLRTEAPSETSTQRPYAVKVGIDGGPLVRYTTRGPDADMRSDADSATPVPPMATLQRKAESFLHRELQKRLDTSVAVNTKPRITLNPEGRIQALSPAARRALEYAPDATPAPNFFSHVAGRNLGRVLRDLGRMVQGNRQHARWLVRLRTGSGRWRWYRAEVHNELEREEAITITVWPLGIVRTSSTQNS